MLWARSVMDDWIGEDGRTPHVKTLTGYFLALYFIMATQVNEVLEADHAFAGIHRLLCGSFGMEV